MAPRHALITGGAGFIGSHLADTLLARGFRVTVLDCLLPQVHELADRDADGWPTYLDRRVRRIRGDVLQPGVIEAALPGVTHLAHLAASVGVGQSMTNMVDYTRNNTLAAAVVLEALAKGGHTVERIAVASSMSIYGEGAYRRPSTGRMVTPPPRSREQLMARRWDLELDGERLEPMPTPEDKRLQPASIYAINKRDHEDMFLAVGRALDIPTVALRLFNAYGSRQALSNPYTGVAAIFISRLLNDRPPLVFEDGAQLRDFVHVGDVAEAFATVLEDEAPIWDAFNVGSGRSIGVGDLAVLLARVLHKNIAPEFLQQSRAGDIRHCYPDVSRFARAFGAPPARDLETGLGELVEWVGGVSRPKDRAEESLRQLAESRLVV